MARKIDYNALLGALQRVGTLLPTLNPENSLREIKDLDRRKFDDVIRECRDFQESVERATEDCRVAVESPIYIGVVGHFSHGKSSLLNSLLFPPRSAELLPIGDGVVTSLCTLLQFSTKAETHEFYEIRQGGDETYLPQDDYQSRVSGRGANLAGNTSHFKLRLDVQELSDPLFKDFAEKQIELLDTPGLGGPYWKDEEAMIAWMKEFVLLVICIKASDINETTAETVNPFIRHTTKPIIPVITFWDQWRKSPDFKGITSEDAARREARKRIGAYFPLLKQYEDETIFVSAKFCMEAKPVEEKNSSFFTPEWNVDNVRRKLAGYVQERGHILRTQKSKESALDSQRRASVRQLAVQLCSSSATYLKHLESQIRAAMPKGSYETVIDTFRDEFTKELDHEKDQIAGQVERSFRGAIANVSKVSSWGSEVATIKDQADLAYKDQKARSVKRLLTFFERFRMSVLDQTIRESGLVQRPGNQCAFEMFCATS